MVRWSPVKCPRAVIVLALTAGAAFAADARAQTAELSALGGYGFGGSLTAPAGGADVPIESGVLYGGAFSMPFAGTWRIEGLITRQESRVTDRVTGTDVAVALERCLAGIQEEKSNGGNLARLRVVPHRRHPSGAGGL